MEQNSLVQNILNINDDSVKVIALFPQIFPQVLSFSFHVYQHSLSHETRLAESGDASFLQNLEDMELERKLNSHSVVIRDAVVAATLSEGNVRKYTDTALLHDIFEEETVFEVEGGVITEELLREKILSLPDNSLLAIRSPCVCKDGSVKHISLMDFQCPFEHSNTHSIEYALDKMGIKSGVLLRSGRSYHFIGFDLLTEAEWIEFLGMCTLVSPLIDTRYVGHQLLRKACALRISSNTHKPVVPRVVAILNGSSNQI